MTPLRQRMIEKLNLRNYSPKTIKAYVAAVAQVARHFGRSPDQLTAADIHLWQLHLRDTRKVSWSGFNIAMCALRFFFREIAERDELIPRLAFMRPTPQHGKQQHKTHRRAQPHPDPDRPVRVLLQPARTRESRHHRPNEREDRNQPREFDRE